MEASVTTTNRPNTPPPVRSRADKTPPEVEIAATPIQPPFAGIPEPPTDEEEKENAMRGYVATAQHAREPFEPIEIFEARMKQQAADFEKQQKDGAAGTKKLMDFRAKQEEAAAKK